MNEFWEQNFINKQTMWGFDPSNSATITKDFFLKNDINDILLPGSGYGRNAKVFLDNNINVTGIEISKTAINLAKSLGLNMKIFHGSVNDMPFDNKLYDGIFSYGLIHLLSREERKKFISDCYTQLKSGGYMIFTAVSTKAPMFGKGVKLSENYYQVMDDLTLFFYTSDSIKEEFSDYGLVDFLEINEIDSDNKDKTPINFLYIKCKK